MNVWVLWGSKTQTPLRGVQHVNTLAATAGWRWTRTKLVAGDFNGDGTADIAILHQNSDDGMNVWVLWGSKVDTPLSGKQQVNTLAASAGWRWTRSLVG
jgi:hypothetical protein